MVMSNAPYLFLWGIILDIDAVVGVRSCYNDTKETTDTGKIVKGECWTWWWCMLLLLRVDFLA